MDAQGPTLTLRSGLTRHFDVHTAVESAQFTTSFFYIPAAFVLLLCTIKHFVLMDATKVAMNANSCCQSAAMVAIHAGRPSSRQGGGV